MIWKYRVIRRTHPSGEVLVGIYEVYYMENDEKACTQEPSLLVDDVDELRRILARMLKALDEPVLDYDEDFPSGSHD